MTKENGSLSPAERFTVLEQRTATLGQEIRRVEREMNDRMSKLEIAWAKAAVVIVVANALVVFGMRALFS